MGALCAPYVLCYSARRRGMPLGPYGAWLLMARSLSLRGRPTNFSISKKKRKLHRLSMLFLYRLTSKGCNSFRIRKDAGRVWPSGQRPKLGIPLTSGTCNSIMFLKRGQDAETVWLFASDLVSSRHGHEPI